MAIISFEEIEQQVVEQESPVDTVADKELLEESVGISQDQAEAIEELDDTIVKQDELISDVEEGKKDPEEVKEELHESMIAAEHFCQVLIDGSLKEVTRATNTDLSFESINSDPLASIKDFNNMLKSIRTKISQEAVEEVKKGFFEKFLNFFKARQDEFKKYRDISKSIVSVIEANKNSLSVRPDIEISSANSVLATEFVLDVGKNYAEFIDKYFKALEDPENHDKAKLKHVDNFKYVEAAGDNGAPVGFRFGKKDGSRIVISINAPKLLEQAINKGPGVSKIIKKEDLSFMESVIEPKELLKFKSVDEALKTLKNVDKMINEHFTIVDGYIKRLKFYFKTGFANDAVFFNKLLGITGGTALGAVGATAGAGLAAGPAVKSGVNKALDTVKNAGSATDFKDLGQKGLKALKAGVGRTALLTSLGIGAGALAGSYIGSKMFGSMFTVNKVNRKLWDLGSSQIIWGDLVALEKEIVNSLVAKTELDTTEQKELMDKISMSMKGK